MLARGVPAEAIRLSGDTILGYGTTVLSDLGDTVRAYAEHREQRLDQVRDALRILGSWAVDAGPRDIVEIVYADVDRSLWAPPKPA